MKVRCVKQPQKATNITKDAVYDVDSFLSEDFKATEFKHAKYAVVKNSLGIPTRYMKDLFTIEVEKKFDLDILEILAAHADSSNIRITLRYTNTAEEQYKFGTSNSNISCGAYEITGISGLSSSILRFLSTIFKTVNFDIYGKISITDFEANYMSISVLRELIKRYVTKLFGYVIISKGTTALCATFISCDEGDGPEDDEDDMYNPIQVSEYIDLKNIDTEVDMHSICQTLLFEELNLISTTNGLDYTKLAVINRNSGNKVMHWVITEDTINM